MKGLCFILAMSWIQLFIPFPVFSQEEVLEIQSESLGKHERPVVKFPHLIHEDFVECSECHHEYDESGENIGGDGGFCSECHTKNAGANPVPLKKAFHLLCKECHKKAAKNEKKKAPLMCGQCHRRER